MTDNRKNLKIQPETYDKLKDNKHDYETWDGYFRRLLTEANE